MYLLGETYRHLAEKEGVEIRLNTRVDRAYVEKVAPDALIVAAGSEPLLPPIPGLRESPIMFPAEDYHLKKDSIGETCIVLGGGLVGREEGPHRGDAKRALPGRQRAVPAAADGGDVQV